MPTKRKRTNRGRRRATSPTAWAWLTDAPMPEDADQWELLDLQHPTSARLLDSCRALWEQHRNEILAAWVKEKPGTRPARWWEFDAPRSDIGTYSGENQAAFLDRHDLLTPSEKRAMALESYEPQAMVFEPGD